MKIKTWVTNALQKIWPDREVRSNYTDDSSTKRDRYIQISVAGANELIPALHYEYDKNKVVFHIEAPFNAPSYSDFRRYVRQKSKERCPDLKWTDFQGHSNCQCCLTDQNPDSIESLEKELRKLMDIFDGIVADALKEAPNVDTLLTSHKASDLGPADASCEFKREVEKSYDVIFRECSFPDLMSLDLCIPSYQRNYCWDEGNISSLWNSISSSNGEIQLGNIILQNVDNRFQIIDGQQRLITLTLFAMVAGYGCPLPLLKEKIKSTQGVRNIANAKNIIKKLYQRKDARLKDEFGAMKGKHIRFGLLVLGKDTSLDLAYTFFNSNNAKGVPLSDYDLLKAHHLQYVNLPKQAHHLASKWDKMSSSVPFDHIQGKDSHPAGYKDAEKYKGLELKVTLGNHLLRLRKWMRLLEVGDAPHRVRDEFIAAPILDSIPPFGEKFDYYEKIQGGPHFFAYAEKFTGEYSLFTQTREYRALNGVLTYSSHIYYREAIETLLFAYFLKFHTQYLPEALFCISSIIGDDRYSSGQMRRKRLWQHAKNSRVTMMIDQATSPTFFLAEAVSNIKINPLTLGDDDFKGRREQFYNELRKAIKSIYPAVSEPGIKQKIAEIYELDTH